MPTSIFDLAPFIPADSALAQSELPDKVMQLVQLSARLAGQLAPLTLITLEHHMSVINSYYSNLIEGNATPPHEIRAAQRGDYDADPAKRDLQLESLAHMAVQAWIRDQQPDLDTLYSPAFILQVHHQFYSRIPENLWQIKDERNTIVDIVVPGAWRTRAVRVGNHVPPAAEDLPDLMAAFCDNFHPRRHSGDRKVLAIMAAHHRLEWLHPFLDGNGRVGRLLTDTALKAVGLDSYGAWCLSRGLAKSATRYKRLLALADNPRQGNLDGRGALTEQGLMQFCDYMLDTAIDQVTYMSKLLDLPRLRQRIDSYVQARNDFRVSGVTEPLKSNASLILYTAFIHGEIGRAEALELCAMPERSARRLLSQLKSEGLLSETSSKSPLRWEVPEHAEPWYFPDLTPTA
ncbi:MAG: Fic family protein [Pseudohongiella sp.]|nr:Fic family protein [Pseudohongiella sp.]